MKKLPKQIFVVKEGDKGEEYLEARETIKDLEEGSKVGIYQLVETKTMRITEELV